MRGIFSSAIVQIKQSMARPMFRFCILLNPVFSGFLIGMMYKNKSLEDFMLYAFIGSGMSIFWESICYSSAGDIDREKWLGTLPILFVSPLGFKKIITGKIIGNTILGCVSFLLNMTIVLVCFDKKIYFDSISYFTFILVITVVSMFGIGVLLAGLFTISREVRLWMNFIVYPILILSGMIFPVNILPNQLQNLSKLFSFYWSMKGFELAIKGGIPSEKYEVAMFLFFMTIIYLTVSFFVLNRIEYLCKVKATLEVF